MQKSISRTISDFAISLQYKDLPKEVINEVKRYLYDSIGCAYGGYHTKDVKIIQDIYTEMAGKREATVIGFGDKLPAVNTTLNKFTDDPCTRLQRHLLERRSFTSI